MEYPHSPDLPTEELSERITAWQDDTEFQCS